MWDVNGSGKCMRTYMGFTKVCPIWLLMFPLFIFPLLALHAKTGFSDCIQVWGMPEKGFRSITTTPTARSISFEYV